MGKREPSYTARGMEIGAATMKTVQGFLKILKIELPCDSAIPLVGVYLKNTKTLI